MKTKSPILMTGAHTKAQQNDLTAKLFCAILCVSHNERHQMAGKAKSVYLTVTKKGSFKTEFSKVFFDAKSFNEYIKTDEFKAKWPAEEFNIVKEIY